MAKQLGGINGPYLGKVGKVVGYQWRGQWVTRAVPEEFHDAKTERQLEQRGRFKASVAFAARLRDILLMGLRQSAQKAHKTEYNYFQMLNNGCLAWDGEALAVDYPNLKLSEGPVAPVAFHRENEELRIKNEEYAYAGELRQPNSSFFTLHFSFEKNPEHRNCNSNDKVYVAAVNAVRCEAVLSLPVYRRMRSVTVELPENWEGEEVHLYGFVQDLAGRASECAYIGTVEEMGEIEEMESRETIDEKPAGGASGNNADEGGVGGYFSSSRTFSMSSSSPPT